MVLGSSMKTTVTPWSGSSCGRADAGAEGVAVLGHGGVEIGHRDGDVVEATDHPRFPARRDKRLIRSNPPARQDRGAATAATGASRRASTKGWHALYSLHETGTETGDETGLGGEARHGSNGTGGCRCRRRGRRLRAGRGARCLRRRRLSALFRGQRRRNPRRLRHRLRRGALQRDRRELRLWCRTSWGLHDPVADRRASATRSSPRCRIRRSGAG